MRLAASLADSTVRYVVLASSAVVGTRRLVAAVGLDQLPPCAAHAGVWPLPLKAKHGAPVPVICSSEKPVSASLWPVAFSAAVHIKEMVVLVGTPVVPSRGALEASPGVPVVTPV